MDFIRVGYKERNDGTREFAPALLALESQDLVIRGGQFAAIWDEDTKLYSRRISHMPAIIDRAFVKMVGDQLRDGDVVKKVVNFDNQIMNRLMSLIRSIGDMGPELDQTIVFADQTPTKEQAATFKVPYSLVDAPHPSWDTLVDKLYEPEQRAKIEWGIGSILTGASVKNVQKFYVFFGDPGTGKSTIMDVMEKLFEGHTATFSALELGKSDSAFSLEPFSKNPLVAIDQDADLSKIEQNTLLNKLVSHDKVMINSKGKNLFPIIPRGTIFAGTNKGVKITDRKSGLYRRLVDIVPTGDKFEEREYHALVAQVQFELGAIAQHCIDVFEAHGSTYLSSYRATDMMYRTNDVFNFVEDNRLILSQGIALRQAHKLYIQWCEETETRQSYKQYQFRDVLADYYHEFHREIMIDGVRHRSWFAGLRDLEKFSWKGLAPAPPKSWLELQLITSLFDHLMIDMPAQEASISGTPKVAWENCETTLRDIDPTVEHFVKVPTQHIVIDFDLKDEDGTKSLERNLEAASHWPATYAEVSRGGGGLHLHYDFTGDVTTLAPAAPDGSYEVKALLGGSSLRRRLSLCNDIPVASISSGLPLKEEKVLSPAVMANEKTLRAQVAKALRKEVHLNTKSNMDFIEMVTKEAFEMGADYDISDMWDDILQFAMSSSNQKSICIEIAMRCKLASEKDIPPVGDDMDVPIAVFDLEVYPNLVAIGWMHDRDDAEVNIMINPKPHEVEELLAMLRLLGWNNRYYDNHILWALCLGWSIEQIYDLSQRIIAEKDKRAGFGPAYALCYGDLYDMASNDNMKSLKKWEIDLGLPHMEMDLPWDQPVPEDRMEDVLEYLRNDVRSTRAVMHAIEADVRARQILAEISGLTVAHTNKQHTERMIFGEEAVKSGETDLRYTDLSDYFPGYKFDQFQPGKDKSTYRGYSVGEGGWVDSVPGMYYDVAVLDVASMHPTSIVELNAFGQYTPKFKELLDVRLAIKRGNYDAAGQAFNGRLKPYLGDKTSAKALSDALKIVINSVYGLTAASFPNAFKDPKNIDNIVAKRGALFMVDLKLFVEQRGHKVVHVKTDSIKIPNADPIIIQEAINFAKDYGYDLEHEATYSRFCLVNDSTFVARTYQPDGSEGAWSAKGAQYQHPVVFKTLFTHEEIEPGDYVEVKQVSKSNMYLVSEMSEVRQFVGRFGAFVPVTGGRTLLRVTDDGKEGAVGGTKGFTWELDDVAFAEHMDVDYQYFQVLIDKARENIAQFGDFAGFTRP